MCLTFSASRPACCEWLVIQKLVSKNQFCKNNAYEHDKQIQLHQKSYLLHPWTWGFVRLRGALFQLYQRWKSKVSLLLRYSMVQNVHNRSDLNLSFWLQLREHLTLTSLRHSLSSSYRPSFRLCQRWPF